MITLIIFLLVVIVLAVEGVSVWGRKRQPIIEFDVDTSLVEPYETATLYYTVSNPYRLPFLFVGFSLFLDKDVTVCEDAEFLRLHVSKVDAGTKVGHNFYLPARSRFTGKLRFSVKSRGLRDLGQYFLETGDFLGLFPLINTGQISRRVICTTEKCSISDLEYPGGEIGDISVRRFIIDDPTMLLGYREYTGREPMKQISWKQTAKTGRMMVRQNDYTTDRIAVVMVDMFSSQRGLLESCLKIARTVCEQLEDAKVPYSLMSNGDLLTVPEGIGREHLFFVLKRLGLSRLAGYTAFSSLIEQCVRIRKSNCTYIVIAPEAGQDIREQVDYLGSHTDCRPVIMIPSEKGAVLI